MSDTLAVGDWPLLEAGRTPAGQALLDWAADPDAARLCLVGGSAGIGKSQLLAWFTTRADEHRATRVHALVPAAGQTLGPLLWDLSFQLGWGVRSVAELLARAAQDERPLLIAVPDLHAVNTEGSRSGARFVPDVLQPLLGLPWVRVLAESRSPADTGFTGEAVLIDLDDPALTDPQEYGAWYDALPSGGSRSPVPASRVHPHPVLGRLAAALLHDAELPAGPVDRSVCTAWWHGQHDAVRGALRTLALTRGPVDAAMWRRLHAGLHPGDEGTAAAVDAAAAVLAWQREEFRLPLPQLALLTGPQDGEPGRSDALVFDALFDMVPRDDRGIPDWADAPGYVLDHITEHAPAATDAGRLLRDPGFLAYGSPSAISKALDDPRVVTPPSLRTAWYPAAPALSRLLPDTTARAAVLHASALATAPRLATLLAPLVERGPVVARWSRLRLALPPVNGSGRRGSWPGPVTALAPAVPTGELVAADPLGQLRLLDSGTGAVTGRTVNRPSLPVAGIAPLADGGFVLLDPDGTVHPSPPSCDATLAGMVARHDEVSADGPARVSSLSGDPYGRLVVLGDVSGTAVLYDLREEQPTGFQARLSGGALLTAVCCLRTRGGNPLVVGASADGAVRLWAPPDEPLAIPLLRRATVPVALAMAGTPAGPVLTVGWADGTVDVMRLDAATVRQVHPHHSVTSLALTPEGLLVAAGPEGITGWQCDVYALD